MKPLQRCSTQPNYTFEELDIMTIKINTIVQMKMMNKRYVVSSAVLSISSSLFQSCLFVDPTGLDGVELAQLLHEVHPLLGL